MTRGQFGHTRGGSAGHVLQHHMDFAGGYVPVLLRHEHGTSRQICKGWFLCWRQLAGRNGFVTDAQGEVVVAPPPRTLREKGRRRIPSCFLRGVWGPADFQVYARRFGLPGKFSAPVIWPKHLHIPIAVFSSSDHPKQGHFERYGSDLAIAAFYYAWSCCTDQQDCF